MASNWGPEAAGEMEEGVAAKVVLTNEAGEEIGTVMVPYDPDNQPSEEEVHERAWRIHHTTTHIRGQIDDEDVTSLAESLRTGEYGAMMNGLLRDYIETLEVTVTSDDGDDDPEAIAEAEETGREIEEIIRERRSELVEAFMGGTGIWEEVARDMLTHAWTWAFEELYQEYPTPESIDDATFDRELTRRYRERPYLYQAIMQLTPQWGQFILEQIAATLSRKDDLNGAPGPAQILEEKARERVRKRRGPRPNLSSPALSFDDGGRGFLPSNGLYRAINQGLGRFSEWKIQSGDLPEHQLPAKYGVRGHLSIAGDNALRIWEGIRTKAKQAKQQGDILPDVYIVTVATIHEHRGRLDLFGNGQPYISLEAIMPNLGFRKSDRKYDTEDIEKVIHAYRAIGDIRVRGQRTAYVEGSKPVTVPFEGPIWQIMDTIPKTRTQRELEAFLGREKGEFTDDGGDGIPPQSVAGWTLALGAGMLTGEDEIAQEARVMRALMSYPPVHGRFKRRLGFSLSCEFRLRYREQNWKQPYIVRDVLEDASLTVDTRNPGRTYKLFHEALETLQEDRIIGEVRYIKPPRPRRPFDPGYDTGLKGWLEQWLSAKIVIMPPADVEAEYRTALEENLAKRPRRRKPALTSAG